MGLHGTGDRLLSWDLIDRIDVLRGRECLISELPGGITNRNFKVVTDGGAAYVVRVSPLELVLPIDRDVEYRNSVIAASTGVGAPVIAYLAEDLVLVIGYIDGVTFTDESFDAPGTVERVARACRRLHAGPRFVNDFDMFDVQAGYLRQVLSSGYRLPPDYLDYTGHVERLRAAMAVRPEATVPCNNDLLAGNLIDDGSDIRLIDYEYSGNNDPCFELGNLASECHLSPEQLECLVTCYYGRPRMSRMARARLQGLMSQYGWTLWASIQDATSPIDFRYWDWGMEKYERAVALFRSPEFDRLLDLVQHAD